MKLFERASRVQMLGAVAIMLLLFLHFTRILRPVENFLVDLTQPIYTRVYGVSQTIGGWYLDYRTKQALVDENGQLKKQIGNLERERSQWLTEKEENEFLRKQFDFVDHYKYNYRIARVVGINFENTQSSLIIDLGSDDGLMVGQPVLAEEGTLVGKVYLVREKDSIVLLANDDLFRAAGKIQNKDKVFGLIAGEFGLGVRMGKIPQSENIAVGDAVVTSGLEELIPANLLIGRVAEVINSPEELFQFATIQSPVNFKKLSFVNIVVQSSYAQ